MAGLAQSTGLQAAHFKRHSWHKQTLHPYRCTTAQLRQQCQPLAILLLASWRKTNGINRYVCTSYFLSNVAKWFNPKHGYHGRSNPCRYFRRCIRRHKPNHPHSQQRHLGKRHISANFRSTKHQRQRVDFQRHDLDKCCCKCANQYKSISNRVEWALNS